MPGRLQIVGEDPLTLLDGAHNPEGMAALAESLPEIIAGHGHVVAVVSILDDKDAAGMLAAAARAAATRSSSPAVTIPGPCRRRRLQSLARQLHGPAAEVVRDPHAAVRRARELAGPGGVVLATGSIYLVADLLRPSGTGTRLDAVNDGDDQPSFLTMIGLVALIVAVVILVFFGIGYLFGRLFL